MGEPECDMLRESELAVSDKAKISVSVQIKDVSRLMLWAVMLSRYCSSRASSGLRVKSSEEPEWLMLNMDKGEGMVIVIDPILIPSLGKSKLITDIARRIERSIKKSLMGLSIGILGLFEVFQI
jgi:hypothetical protein